MKQPKPDKFVVMLGIPITVHSAGVYPNGSSTSNKHSFATLQSPSLTVRREDTQVTTSDKLLVIKTQDRVIRVEELWVEDDLDPIGGSVEQLDPSDLIQDWVVGVVGHVVRDDGWEGVSLQGEDSSLEEDLVLGGQ
jgi:hypothetical protein